MRHAEESSFYKVYILNVVVHVRAFMMLCYLLKDVAYSCTNVSTKRMWHTEGHVCSKVYT